MLYFYKEGDKIYKKNKFDGLYYWYYEKEMDNGELWDPFLHENDGRKIDWVNNVCPYCHHSFEENAKLKNHLGFMNIEVKLWLSIIEKRFPSKVKEIDIDLEKLSLGKRKRDTLDIMFKKLKII